MARQGIQDSGLYVLVEYRNPDKGSRTHIIRSPTGAILADGYDNYGMGKHGKKLRVRIEDMNAKPEMFVPLQQKDGVSSLTGATSPKSGAKGKQLVNVPDDPANDAVVPDGEGVEGDVVVPVKPAKAQEDTLLRTETKPVRLTPQKPNQSSGSGKGGAGNTSGKG